MPPNPESGTWSAERATPPETLASGGFDRDRSNGGFPAYVEGWSADSSDVGDYGGPEADQPYGFGPYGSDEPSDRYGLAADAPLNPNLGHKPRSQPQYLAEDDGYEDDGDYDYEYEDGYDDRDYDDYFDDDEDDFEDLDSASSATRNALEWAVVLVGAVLVALLLRASLFQAFWIPSESMETTLLTNDRVLVNKVSYRLHDIHRGDVIVFARPDQEPGEIRDLIKRVIALPGEKVEARDNAIYINEQRLDEPYLDEGIVTGDFGPTVVPEGEVFVMGDNRGDSYDSRWFGTVSEERVVGRAFVLFWPVGRVGSL